MLIRQNQAWPNLLSKIWWSRFKRLSIRQDQAKSYLIFIDLMEYIYKDANPTKSGLALSNLKDVNICLSINKVLKFRILQRMKSWQRHDKKVFCQIHHLIEWNISHFCPPAHHHHHQKRVNKSWLTLALFCHLI